jgi:ABC-type amino acid transport substrate-binding protein
MRNSVSRYLFFILLVSSILPAANAESILERIKRGGSLVLAYRDASVPFSYVDADKKPIGYAVELCQKIAEAVGRKVGVKNVPLDYLLVNSANRIAAIEGGKADLECGSTTNNAERRTRVAFTIPHFITGARMLVKKDSRVERLEDLMMGKTLVSTKGTTPLKAVDQVNKERLLRINILEAEDHTRAVEMVEKGQAEAFVMDDVLLYGLAAGRPNPAALKVVGKFLTTEPLAIMLSKDDLEFKKVVDDEMRRLIVSREIYSIYNKWFASPIAPSNAALNMPVNYLMRDFWKYPTDKVPF